MFIDYRLLTAAAVQWSCVLSSVLRVGVIITKSIVCAAPSRARETIAGPGGAEVGEEIKNQIIILATEIIVRAYISSLSPSYPLSLFLSLLKISFFYTKRAVDKRKNGGEKKKRFDRIQI